MTAAPERIALLYDDDAYVEVPQVTQPVATDRALGLMGRHVAGKEFLDALVRFGRWTELVALVQNQASAESLQRFWQSRADTTGRRLRILNEREFHRTFLAERAAPLLHMPGPLHARHAWVRQHAAPAAFALSGITHTICDDTVAHAICSLVTAPFEPYDTLVCISRAAVEVVRTVADTYAGFLRERHGGTPALRVRLEHIPLGVNAEKYRPPTREERARMRHALHIADDEVAVLFVGRLSFHAKVHPFPMFVGVSRAARATGRKVHLVLAGWTANEPIRNAIVDGAQRLAEGVRVTIVDGTLPQYRYDVWHAADIFTSLSDNIQETLSQVILEAMACGLPVVATNWNGCRDQVVDGETGFLVPAYHVKHASADATSRLLLQEMPYDLFLAECNQAVAVDTVAATAAFRRLIEDEALRRRMGAAGRQRVLERFTWGFVVGAYEDLWAAQDRERLSHESALQGRKQTFAGPACFPAPEVAFASYPTALLDDTTQIEPAEGAVERLRLVMSLPLTNYVPESRVTDPGLLQSLLANVPCALADLDRILLTAGVATTKGRATIAWMLKYDLLRVAARSGGRRC